MQINNVTSLSNNSQLNAGKIKNNFAKTNLISKTECDSVEIKKNNSNNVSFNGKVGGGIAKMAGGLGIIGVGAILTSTLAGVLSIISLLAGGFLATWGGKDIVEHIDHLEEIDKNKEIQKEDIKSEQ